MIKSVIFDIDDTLYSFKSAHNTAMVSVCRYAEEQLGLDPQEFLTRYDGMMEKQRIRSGDNCAMHSRYIRFQMMMEEYGLSLRHVLPLNDLYWTELVKCSVPEPGMLETLDALRAKGIRIGVGTDMTLDWQLEKLIHLDMLERIDFVVTSEEAGAEKPYRAFFDLCLAKAGCQREECIFIGDNLKKDALGGQNYGFHGVWYQPDAAKAATHPEIPSIGHMSRLMELVESL